MANGVFYIKVPIRHNGSQDDKVDVYKVSVL